METKKKRDQIIKILGQNRFTMINEIVQENVADTILALDGQSREIEDLKSQIEILKE